MIKKTVIILVIIMVASFLTSGIIFISTGGIKPLNMKGYTVNEEAVFTELEEIDYLYIKATNEDINIINTDTNEIKAQLVGHLNGIYYTSEYDLITSKVDHKINIEAKTKFIGYLIFSSDLELNIYLPKSYNHKIVVDSTNGDVYLNDREFEELDISTTNGDLIFKNISANNGYISTTNGKVKINSLTGKHTISSTNGDISLSVKDSFDLSLSTTNGDVTITNVSNSSIDISTINGDINQLSNFSGTLRQHYVNGVIGTGVNKIKVSTTNGDVEIKS